MDFFENLSQLIWAINSSIGGVLVFLFLINFILSVALDDKKS